MLLFFLISWFPLSFWLIFRNDIFHSVHRERSHSWDTWKGLAIAWFEEITFWSGLEDVQVLAKRSPVIKRAGNVYVNENHKEMPLFRHATGCQSAQAVVGLNMETGNENTRHMGEIITRGCFQYGLRRRCTCKWKRSPHLMMVTVICISSTVRLQPRQIHSDISPSHSL